MYTSVQAGHAHCWPSPTLLSHCSRGPKRAHGRNFAPTQRYRLGRFPAETSSMYDFWVTYLAVRTGMGAWYLPERLARYRIHGANETSVGGAIRPAIYVYSRLVADANLAELRPGLQARLQQAHLNYGIFLLKKGFAGQSRQYLRAAMPNRRAAAALALSYAPKVVRSLALSASGVR